MKASPWLTRDEAAAYSRVSPRFFSKLVKAGRLPKGHRLGRRRVWSAAELDAAIAGLAIKEKATDPIEAALYAVQNQVAQIRQ